MFLFDAHLDLAWNAVEWNRDLRLSVAEVREFERPFTGAVPGDCMVTFPALRRGNIGLVIATLLPRFHRPHKPLTFPQQRETAYAMAKGQLAYYQAMCASGVLREIGSVDQLETHLAEWSAGPKPDSPIGYILSMEGSPPILSPAQIPEWFAAGLKILGPAHYGPNPYCFGTGSSGGFNPNGRELLREMDRVGMLLDVTHLADESFWDALNLFNGPVLASHHNCRTLVPGDRQLSDEQIRALIDRGAVIGAAFDNWMLKPGWVIGVTDPATVTLNHVVDHIDHICQLAGNANHCGLGTDLDGGFGKEQSPSDLASIADLPIIAERLRDRGYSAEDIERILHGNWVNFFRRAWSA